MRPTTCPFSFEPGSQSLPGSRPPAALTSSHMPSTKNPMMFTTLATQPVPEQSAAMYNVLSTIGSGRIRALDMLGLSSVVDLTTHPVVPVGPQFVPHVKTASSSCRIKGVVTPAPPLKIPCSAGPSTQPVLTLRHPSYPI